MVPSKKGVEEDISEKPNKKQQRGGNSQSNQVLSSMKRVDLESLAKCRGVKIQGTGWNSCCPPKATKPDIIRAIINDGFDESIVDNVVASTKLQLRDLNISRHKDAVFNYRHNVDLYTNLSRDDFECLAALPFTKIQVHVDHIWEVQVFRWVIAKTRSIKGGARQFTVPIYDIVNSTKTKGGHQYYNLNNTFGSLNISKGQVVKQFLGGLEAQKRQGGNSLLAYAIGTKVAPYMSAICQAMNDAFPRVHEELSALRRQDGFVTGEEFSEVASMFQTVYDQSKIEGLDTGRQTRQDTKNQQELKTP